MAEEAVPIFCSPAELASLAKAMGAGSAKAFCERLAPVAAFDSAAPADAAVTDVLGDRLSGIEEGVNTFFLTVNGALVFIMHAGFAMVRWDECQLASCGASLPS